jgi:hypothetical protein
MKFRSTESRSNRPSSPLKYSEIQQKSCKNRLKNEFVSPVFEYFNGLLGGSEPSRATDSFFGFHKSCLSLQLRSEGDGGNFTPPKFTPARLSPGQPYGSIWAVLKMLHPRTTFTMMTSEWETRCIGSRVRPELHLWRSSGKNPSRSGSISRSFLRRSRPAPRYALRKLGSHRLCCDRAALGRPPSRVPS